ncbi:alpha/beta fold hydrolase [Roseibacterium sp. SDUM158016]|uniref:alpha/beta fold hydrolase n=1 Tax=Roseicyclus sediminis TaxID=2980997 RepID=UPI0021CED570|nr:alpha/beta fold hydrolase [Roseibacterium sp. SDUM158016]MCU4653180.1 alpha/beta fold hydrolase [Roseibacterium sp. SDUM158016]
MLHTVIQGTDAVEPPILIAHGLFGSARNWGVIAKRLSEGRKVLAVDMRNHGESPWSDRHGYADLAGDLAEVIAAHAGQADVVGHSMGGKAAMALALSHPQTVRRLVVADIAPVAYGHSQQPMIDAMRSVDLSRVATRRDADAQLAAIVPEDGVRAFLLQSLDVAGRRWRLNLDALSAEMAGIVGWPDLGGSFEGPTLFLSGALSDYVRPEYRDTIRALFPAARFAKIPGAGHWLHAEKPREFEAALRAFLTADASSA